MNRLLNPVTDFKPHSKNSPWTNVLVGCATANDVHSLCSMETLPYVGAITDSPTIQDVMQRVVVSHGWMGQRFANVLKQLPPEMLKMFRGVTAIVIGSEVRPSFFTPLTSAIHIDPQDLWLTPAERNTIDWEPDYRSDFGAALNFIPVSYYLAGSNYAWYSSSSYPEDYTRGMSDIIWPLGYILIHELAHANDYIHLAITPDAAGTRRGGHDRHRSGPGGRARLGALAHAADARLSGAAAPAHPHDLPIRTAPSAPLAGARAVRPPNPITRLRRRTARDMILSNCVA